MKPMGGILPCRTISALSRDCQQDHRRNWRTRFIVDWPTKKEIDIGDAVINNNKIKTTLNWTPVHDLQSGLAKTRKFYEGCLEHYLR
jgi:dTDP-D-glucose 4,6-dehydratase